MMNAQWYITIVAVFISLFVMSHFHFIPIVRKDHFWKWSKRLFFTAREIYRKILHALWWVVWEFSGVRAIFSKIFTALQKDKNGYPPATFMLWIVGIYAGFFGIASQRYENRIDIIENRANAIFAQLATNAYKSALNRIPDVQRMWCPEKPDILNPPTVFRSLFRNSVYSEVEVLLRETVEDWKSNLAGIDLKGANLVGANLEGANLEGANLVGANLREANLKGAYLVGADLKGANFRKANLAKAILRDANLRRGPPKHFLTQAQDTPDPSIDPDKYLPTKTDLVGAILTGADLEGADFSETELMKAKLNKANLKGARLVDAYLDGAYLKGANLKGAMLVNAELSETNLSEANLEGALLMGANFRKGNLEGANLKVADLRGATNLVVDQICSTINIHRTVFDKDLELKISKTCPQLMQKQI